MSDLSKLRSSINGFNRSDVVAYIENLSADHQKQLQKLEREKEALQKECDRLSGQLSEAENMERTLREQDESFQQQIVSLAQEAAELQAEKEALLAEKDELLSASASAAENGLQKDATEESAAETLSATEQELAAYRRAEAAERNAIIRANKLHEQLSLLCENTRSRYANSCDEIAALTEDLSSGLSRLQESFAEIQIIFDEAENAFEELNIPEIED